VATYDFDRREEDARSAERMAMHIQGQGGLIMTDDLARSEPTIVEPLVLSHRDAELVLLPYQAGGINTGETFNILDGPDLRSTGFNSAQTLRFIAEASRHGYADRFAYVGDPDHVDTEWDRLASREYADERRAEIDPSHASKPGPGTGISHTFGLESTSGVDADVGCTTHLSMVDSDGNMLSVTQTLTLIFGSAVTAPGTGVLMNDSMNLFDQVPGREKSIAPYKRPASSMAHVVAVRDGVPVLAVGAPGGRRIMDTCMQMVLDVIEFDLDIQQA
jgi:gamma-glutamyltranspeptidase / glutathione hydrolase